MTRDSPSFRGPDLAMLSGEPDYNQRSHKEFDPLFTNPHLATLAGNFWRRPFDVSQFPAVEQYYAPERGVTVKVLEHQPTRHALGQIVFVHGLEGSADAGYIRSMTQTALERGFGVHRTNLRSCGGTEDLSETLYHSGLTSDTRFILEAIQARQLGPIFLVGFSLGGNVVLKLAGELGETRLLAAACGVSVPLDLAECARTIARPANFLYARRFLSRLKARVVRKALLSPHYSVQGLSSVRSIWDFDDRFTGPMFGFGNAENYYRTQSSAAFLDSIRTPTLAVQAIDDPMIPFSVYAHPAFRTNPWLELLAVPRGGHLGFISRHPPRFWLDEVVLHWLGLRA
jgi:uncharacterized protein